jgi:microcystin-dependent protein
MPYLSEIRIFSFNYAPRNWAQCNGQVLSINANKALFSLLGITFGGDGRTTFNLPDFRGGRSPLNWNQLVTWGETGGESAHPLTLNEMPVHFHRASASSSNPDVNSASGANWATNTGYSPYGSHVVTAMSAQALLTTGLGIPHQNMSPYLTLNICISLAGIFPTRG